jgi:hypothetical protein
MAIEIEYITTLQDYRDVEYADLKAQLGFSNIGLKRVLLWFSALFTAWTFWYVFSNTSQKLWSQDNKVPNAIAFLLVALLLWSITCIGYNPKLLLPNLTNLRKRWASSIGEFRKIILSEDAITEESTTWRREIKFSLVNSVFEDENVFVVNYINVFAFPQKLVIFKRILNDELIAILDKKLSQYVKERGDK